MQRLNNFETTSKSLEEFLHVHGIRWVSSYRNIANLTVWVYPRTTYLELIVAEYREVRSRINNTGRSA